MQIKDVEGLAELAKIELSNEEKEALLSDMESILEYVKQVESVEVDSLDPDLSIHNVWREDRGDGREFSMELIKDQFPDSQDGFLKVKKIL